MNTIKAVNPWPEEVKGDMYTLYANFDEEFTIYTPQGCHVLKKGEVVDIIRQKPTNNALPKHTPGPWIVERTSDESGDFQCRILSINAFSDGADAIIVGEPSKRNGYANIHFEANARLIAAAPEMYDALHMVVKYLVASNPTLKIITDILVKLDT